MPLSLETYGITRQAISQRLYEDLSDMQHYRLQELFADYEDIDNL
jgi:hypothetical protein